MHLDPVSLDDYELRDALGSGAMARVFEAIHRATGEPVAIKLLDAAARQSHELRERTAREAVLLASVESPHVARLLGFGWEGEQPFLVLERLEGETLADVLRREQRLAPGRLVDWVEQLLIGVRDCHRVNVIHRDIKPANIFLVRDAPAPSGAAPAAPGGPGSSVKLIDFGVARLNEIASAGASLTSTHHLIGSMGYMAPEQLEYAKGVGPTADLYAVGVVIFRCLTGQLPFSGRSFEMLTRLKCEGTAPLVSSVEGMPHDGLIDAFVARSLSREPGGRFATAGEMLEHWWRVGAAIDRAAPPAEVDVAFDEEQWESTIAESFAKSSASTLSVSAKAGRTIDDLDAPTERVAPFDGDPTSSKSG